MHAYAYKHTHTHIHKGERRTQNYAHADTSRPFVRMLTQFFGHPTAGTAIVCMYVCMYVSRLCAYVHLRVCMYSN